MGDIGRPAARLCRRLGASDPPAPAVLFSAEVVTDIDVTALDALEGYVQELRERGVAVAIAGFKSEVGEQMERAYPLQSSADATFLEVDDGVGAFVDGSFSDSGT